jgi:tRNA(fMet)-specific endonuclease VapC
MISLMLPALILASVINLQRKSERVSDMLRYMLDTTFCIRLLRDRPKGLRDRFNENADALCISTIILSELQYGAEKSAHPARHRSSVENFAARLAVLPFDEAAAAHAANIRADLERKGQTIGGYDVLIAGHARSAGLAVITGNLREFARVDGLMAQDWHPESPHPNL